MIASQITSLTFVYSTVYSGSDQRNHQGSASLAFVWGNHRGPVNSPHKWPVTRKMFPFDDVIMLWQGPDLRTAVCFICVPPCASFAYRRVHNHLFMDACHLLTHIIHGIYIATCTIPWWVQLKSSASITTVYTKNDTASFLVYTVIIGLQEK